jgi:prophage DNA circulation protein
MPTNVIPGAQTFSFGSLVLHGNLQQISAVDEQDIAVHRPLKRNGAIVEGLGWSANRYEAVVMFVGQNFRQDVVNLRNTIRKQSEDVLVHPLYGRFKARCHRISGALNIPAEVNAIAITLSFVEAGLDPNQIAVFSQTAIAKSQVLTANATFLQSVASLYTGAAAVAAVANLVASAVSYATAAVYAVQAGYADPSLLTQVGTIEAQTLTVLAAIQADPAKTLDIDRWDALSAAELVWSAAWDVQDSLALLRPQLVPVVVPQYCSYLTLLNSLYGTTALDREADFFLYNPGITTPHLIPSGTVVYLPQPTV